MVAQGRVRPGRLGYRSLGGDEDYPFIRGLTVRGMFHKVAELYDVCVERVVQERAAVAAIVKASRKV